VIDPEDVLKKLNSKIKPGGLIYISVPNIVNIVERVNISLGRFNYREYGVLDRTHLRFFTRRTALSMVRGVFPDAKIVAVTPRIPQFKYLVNVIPTLFAMQFVIEARNS
jgi:2-polyprenyl-3-methyl-5-hydroxy-6-metoxy-1,4-benzoquinol methylase